MSIMYPHGIFYVRHRDLENTLNFARDVNEAQLRLKDVHPRLYDINVHAGIVAFHLRTISRKMDGLIIELHDRVRSSRGGVQSSRRTVRLQNALREYNAGLAGTDPWDIPLESAIRMLDLAFDCFESVEHDIHAYEYILGR